MHTATLCAGDCEGEAVKDQDLHKHLKTCSIKNLPWGEIHQVDTSIIEHDLLPQVQR